MTVDEKFMNRCIELAKKGAGHVAPNPMVGSVIVLNGEIIAEGYHEYYGGPHAEVNAIKSVVDPIDLVKATIYVNLEPCAHFGKTPPCSDLIIASKIPKVVIGCIDSYSEVAGKGIEKMKAAGIDVTVGVLERESLNLNRRFFTFHTKKRPYIILKWAETKDGFMDKNRSTNDKGIFWITSAETKKIVHQWRHEEAGILVGNRTVANDNPALTCREIEGNSPVRFIIDQKLKLDYGAFKVGDRSVMTYIITAKSMMGSGNLQFVQPKSFAIQDILSLIHELDIQSIIVEGGFSTLNEFIKSNLWDEARILTGDVYLKEGLKSPSIKGKLIKSEAIGKDHLSIIKND